MAKDKYVILDKKPEIEGEYFKLFDHIDHPSGHLLKDDYLIDTMFIAKIKRERDRSFSSGLYNNKHDMVLEVTFNSSVPFGTISLFIDKEETSRLMPSILCTVLPMYVQSEVEKFDFDEFMKYAQVMMQLPYFDVKESYIQDDAVYIHYGVHDKFYSYVNFKLGFEDLDHYCRAGIYGDFDDGCKKVYDNLNIDLVAQRNKPLTYATRYGKFTYKKMAMIKDKKGIWKKTNANNSQIKDMIAVESKFKAPTHSKVGDIFVTPEDNSLIIKKVIAKNDKCDLIQADVYHIEEHSKKVAKVYVHIATRFYIAYQEPGGILLEGYEGKYVRLIDKPTDVEVYNLVHFDEVELSFNNNSYISSHPEQITVEVEDTVDVDGFEVSLVTLNNTLLKTASVSQNLIVLDGRVLRLDSRDSLVQKANKYRNLAKTLSL